MSYKHRSWAKGQAGFPYPQTTPSNLTGGFTKLHPLWEETGPDFPASSCNMTILLGGKLCLFLAFALISLITALQRRVLANYLLPLWVSCLYSLPFFPCWVDDLVTWLHFPSLSLAFPCYVWHVIYTHALTSVEALCGSSLHMFIFMSSLWPLSFRSCHRNVILYFLVMFLILFLALALCSFWALFLCTVHDAHIGEDMPLIQHTVRHTHSRAQWGGRAVASSFPKGQPLLPLHVPTGLSFFQWFPQMGRPFLLGPFQSLTALVYPHVNIT